MGRSITFTFYGNTAPLVTSLKGADAAMAGTAAKASTLGTRMYSAGSKLQAVGFAASKLTPPHEPWEPDPAVLEEKYDRPSLDAAWARIEALRMVIDPQEGVIDEDTFAMLIATIAKKGNIDPLAVLDSNGLQSFIVRTAKLLQSYQPSES